MSRDRDGKLHQRTVQRSAVPEEHTQIAEPFRQFRIQEPGIKRSAKRPIGAGRHFQSAHRAFVLFTLCRQRTSEGPRSFAVSSDLLTHRLLGSEALGCRDSGRPAVDRNLALAPRAGAHRPRGGRAHRSSGAGSWRLIILEHQRTADAGSADVVDNPARRHDPPAARTGAPHAGRMPWRARTRECSRRDTPRRRDSRGTGEDVHGDGHVAVTR